MIDFSKHDYTEVLRNDTNVRMKRAINITKVMYLGKLFDTSYTDQDWLAKDIRYWQLLHEILHRFSGTPWITHPETYTTLMSSDLFPLTTDQIKKELNNYMDHRRKLFKHYSIPINVGGDNTKNERMLILTLLQNKMLGDIVAIAKTLAQLHHVFNVRDDLPTLDLTYSKLGLASGANNQAINT
jgi:hypothetical protein